METRTIKLITPNGSSSIIEQEQKNFFIEVLDKDGVQFLFEILPDGRVFRTGKSGVIKELD